jgi:alkylation response protein AidB-like acyl-CoA dehydrogenase
VRDDDRDELEVRLTRDGGRRMLERLRPFARSGRDASGVHRPDPDVWAAIVELGWTGLRVPAEHDGADASPALIAQVLRTIGEGLIREPVAASSVVCAHLVAHAGTPRQVATLLPRVAGGSEILALAHEEPDARAHDAPPEMRLERRGDSLAVSGCKVRVEGGMCATRLLVTVSTTGSAVHVALVDPAGPGVVRHPVRTVDGSFLAWIELDGAPVGGLLGTDDPDAAAASRRHQIEAALGIATACLCQEAVGAMFALVADTIAHLGTREQFGRPLSEFQVLRHRLVDMWMDAKEAELLADRALVAALMTARSDAGRDAVTAAKAHVGLAGRRVGGAAVHLHGGMGMSDELRIGRYYKRLLAIDATAGNAMVHLRRLAGGMPSQCDRAHP